MPSGNQECPICHLVAGVTVHPGRQGDGGLIAAQDVQCPRCGRFRISEDLIESELVGELKRLWGYLSAYTRQATSRGEFPELRTDNWKDSASKHSQDSIDVKVNRLLQILAQESGFSLDHIDFDWSQDYPLVNAGSQDEIIGLFKHLENSGMLDGSISFGRWSGSLTVEALREAEELAGSDASQEELVPSEVSAGNASQEPDPRKVAVVYGRNEAAKRAMFDFLRAIGLRPIEWSSGVASTGEGSPYPGATLNRIFADGKAIVVLETGDDLARLGKRYSKDDDPPHEKDLTPQARPNVLFEAGMAFGRNPKRTILTSLGKTRPYSNVLGRQIIRLDDGPECRHMLVNQLRAAGCEVDTDGTDWLSAGAFGAAIGPPDERPKLEPETENKRGLSLPNLEVAPGGFHVDERYVGSGGVYTTPISCLHVRFVNDPQVPTDNSIARGIIANISYLAKKDLKPILSQAGRWGDSPQPPAVQKGTPVVDLAHMDFPIGAIRELNLAIKYPEDSDCYAVNNQSYSSPNLRNPNQRLLGEDFIAQVRLRGPYVDRSWKFEFKNLGAGHGLKVGQWEELNGSGNAPGDDTGLRDTNP